MHSMVTFTLDLEERNQSRQRKGTGIPGRKMSDAKPYRQKPKTDLEFIFKMLDHFYITVVLDDLSGTIRDEPRKSRFRVKL